MKNPGQSIEATLAGLKAQRVAIDKAIAGLEEALSAMQGGILPNLPKAGETIQIRSDAFHNMNIVDAARSFLAMTNHTPQTTHQIIDALRRGGYGRASYASVYALLSRAAKGRRIEKLNKNDWGLKEWYSNRKGQATDA